MKVFGNPMSTCTRKVLTTLAEKGHKPEFVNVDLGKGEHKQAAHMARQPFGQVPAIDDNGFQMYESRAICRYIDETMPGTKLTPTDVKDRARMEQWISIEMQNFTPPAMGIIVEALFKPMRGGQPDMAKVEECKKKVALCCDIMEKELEKHEFMATNAFSLADIAFMPYVDYLFACQHGDVIASRPRLAAWWKRVSERPSWKTATGKA